MIYLQQKKTGQQKLHFSSLTIFVCAFLGMTCPCYSLTQDLRVQLHPWVMFVRCLHFVMTGNVLWTFCTGALGRQVKKPTFFGNCDNPSQGQSSCTCSLVNLRAYYKNFDEETKKHQQQDFTCTNITVISVKHHVGVKKPATTWTGWMHGICLQAWYLSHP